MNGISVIGTAAAYVNYTKAKAELEVLQEKYDGILSVVQTYVNLKQAVAYYNEHKEDVMLPDDSWMDEEVKENNAPSDVTLSSMLRLSYMVGKWCDARASVVMTNLSSTRNYYIHDLTVKCSIEGIPVNIFYKKSLLNEDSTKQDPDASYQEVKYTLKPGETKEFEFTVGRSTILNAKGESEMEHVRQIICNAAGKKLITSCPKISIDGVETAFIKVHWSEEGTDGKVNECWFYELPGVLRYCKELSIT